MHGMENAHGLIVGIANYLNVKKLPATVLKDARDISELLTTKSICGYPPENVSLLCDEEATLETMRAGLANLAQRADSESTVFIYVSCHGGQILQGPKAGDYILPVDVALDRAASPVQIAASTAMSGHEFTRLLQVVPARKLLVVLDCCHSAGIGEPKDLVQPEFEVGLSDRLYEKLKTGRGRVILSSSRSDEVSLILAGAQNSLFTKHLLEGLRGAAPGAGGVIRVFDLFRYLQPRVVAEASTQHPFFKAALEEDFPVALYLGGTVSAKEAIAPIVDKYDYDVFLSYRQQEPDRSWVRGQLLPRLEADGLRVCIDFRDFRLGAPLIKEMERAVEHSRYTLAVLTPRYLSSSWTDLETVLAQYAGEERGQIRLVAIMREECEPRLGIRAMRWLDMTHDSEFDSNMDWLERQLRRPPEK